MWEPRDFTAVRDRARAVKSDPAEASGLSAGLVTNTSAGNGAHKPVRLPPEILILNRFGIGLPYLNAAMRVANKHQLDAREVLFRSGIISQEIWLESQRLLDAERARNRKNREQEAWLFDQAVHNLWRNLPWYSAANTWTLSQLVVVNLALLLVLLAVITGRDAILFGLFLVLSAFYTANVLLRAAILAWYDKRVKAGLPGPPLDTQALPVYSLLVPLYKEANQVEQLVTHLSEMDWPKTQLDIKLICESDDLETRNAIGQIDLPPFFDVVVVPPGAPRTKPKALNYALPLCRGEYAVIYDAEDRPSFGQLKEAFARFGSSEENLACLQAPLAIHNREQNWLTAMFAIEYHTLFTGILPVLAKWKVPLPLGGTSNHFKMDILKEVGAWDPFNVTEDADLGIRLFREGYTTSTISLPTFEEAPPNLWPWIAQRTRWIKGWMQTILVHNRNPMRLLADLGFKNTLAFHLLLTTIVVSALIHPVFLALTVIQIVQVFSGSLEVQSHSMIAVGSFNLVAGYTTYGLLAYVVLKTAGMKQHAAMLIFLPLYWILISIAGWRALLQLIVNPHRWEKTPHGLCDEVNSLQLGTTKRTGT